jgi:hypothetical protein
MPRKLALLFFLLAAQPLFAQIADNSFLVEEAYNQEPGVVQHIMFFSHGTHGTDWVSTFTQEWPVSSLSHQLSYTLTGVRNEQERSLGDLALNYRYQLLGNAEAPVAVSPRISAVFSGDSGHLSSAQVFLPVSVAIGPRFVTHWNGGVTLGTGRASWTAAQSVIWLARPRFNPLIETVWTNGRDAHDLIVSPGVRWSHDTSRGLQIVPGIALPISLRNGGDRSVIAYLSFEHAYRRSR